LSDIDTVGDRSMTDAGSGTLYWATADPDAMSQTMPAPPTARREL
jgi:hypothetical protein